MYTYNSYFKNTTSITGTSLQTGNTQVRTHRLVARGVNSASQRCVVIFNWPRNFLIFEKTPTTKIHNVKLKIPHV